MKRTTKAMLAMLVILSLAIALLPHAAAVYPSSEDKYPRTVWSDMGKAGKVSGRVTWGSGDGVAGAYIAIVNASNETQVYFHTSSDQYGDFNIAGINATYSSSNRTGRDGTPATFLESIGMYRIYANVSYANGNYSEGYSRAFGIDADSTAVTAVSITLYTRPATLALRANKTQVDANGEDTIVVTAYGYDARGEPVADGTPITFTVAADGNWTADNGSVSSPGQQSYTAAADAGSVSTSFGWVPYYMGGNNSTVIAYFEDDPLVNASLRIYFAPQTSAWTGYVVDSDGLGYGGVTVKLHVMGTYTNGTPYEIYNMTRATSGSQPFVGLFAFDYIVSLGASYGYVDAQAQLADNLTIYGRSNNYSMNLSRTSIGSIVLKVPPPDALEVTADRDTIMVGGNSTRIIAQLYLNGRPYNRSGIPVTFSSDNDSVAVLPAIRDNVTDSNGKVSIRLTSNETVGTVNVTGTARIMYGHNLSDTCRVRVVGWGTVSGIVTDQNKVGIPNANVTLWNVKWNSSTCRWDTTNMADIPENPQLSNDGRTATVGMYTFYRVPWGVYKVSGEKYGRMWYSMLVLGPWPSGVDAYANASEIPSSEYGTATHNIVMPADFGAFPPSITPVPVATATPQAATTAPKPTPGFEALLVLAGLALLAAKKRK